MRCTMTSLLRKRVLLRSGERTGIPKVGATIRHTYEQAGVLFLESGYWHRDVVLMYGSYMYIEWIKLFFLSIFFCFIDFLSNIALKLVKHCQNRGFRLLYFSLSFDSRWPHFFSLGSIFPLFPVIICSRNIRFWWQGRILADLKCTRVSRDEITWLFLQAKANSIRTGSSLCFAE